MNEYYVSTDKSKLNIDIIHSFLTTSYGHREFRVRPLFDVLKTLSVSVRITVMNKSVLHASFPITPHSPILPTFLSLKRIVVKE